MRSTTQNARSRPEGAIMVVVWTYVWTLLWWGQPAAGSLLASSRVERCVLDGSQDAGNMTCNYMMIVTITVDSGQNDTEALELVLDTTQDVNGNTVTLANPVQVRWAKTVPRLLYPITYVGRTNNKPYETIKYTDDILFLFDECDDSPTSSSPTCGWFHNSDGTVVTDSQGFCCTCDLSEVLWLSNEQTRAGLTCSLFDFGVGASSAHCLRFDDLWYDVFSIGAAQVSFEVVISVMKYQTTPGENGTTVGGYTTETITLSPSQITGTSSGGDIFARLQGDFAPWVDNPVLSEKYLFVPSSPPTDPRVLAGTDYWMLLDRSKADFSGLTCNTIGVSFSAFRYQPSECGNWPQSCLANQLDDYYQADLAMVNQGKLGQYFVRFWGDFANDEPVVQNADQRFLAFTLDEVRATVTTLTINADNITYIVNRSPGKIISATISGFEALTAHGELDVDVMNTGSINADYTITVTDCGPEIEAVLAKTRSLAAYQSSNLTFDLYSLTQDYFDTSCNVSLYDSLGEVVDWVLVNVTVWSTNVTCLGSQCSSGGGGSAAKGSSSFLPSSCSSCSSIIDIACYFDHSCWDKIAEFIACVVLLLCCCSCCCVCLKSKHGRAACMGCLKGMCCFACLPLKAISAADKARSAKNKRSAKLKQKQKKWDKKMKEVEKKLAKKKNDMKKAKYDKKLKKMTLKKATLTEAYRHADFEVSDSSSSDEAASHSPGQRRRPNIGAAAPERSRGRAHDHNRNESHDAASSRRHHRPRSRSLERQPTSSSSSPSRNERNGRAEQQQSSKKKTWDWADMMRNGLRSLHSRNDSVRAKDAELLKMGKRSATAYFNLDSTSATDLLSPGPQFSVRGRLVLLEEGLDVWFSFSLERQHQYQLRYMDMAGDYRDLEQGIELPRTYRQTLITLLNARRFITAEPVFPCINE